MSSQRSLPFDRTDVSESVWRGLPVQAREQVVGVYVGLLVRSIRVTRGKLGVTFQLAPSGERKFVES